MSGYHKFVKQNVEYWNFSMYHNAIATFPALVIYLSTKILGPGKNNAIVTFAFNMTYLLAGYVVTESEDYDITWTMPHCVLTLKLIALSFDVWDGKKMLKGEELSATNLEGPPTFLELLGFVYFIFPFRRYKDFISDKFPLETEAAVYEGQAMKRRIQGAIYLVAYQVGVNVFSMKVMLSDEFLDSSVFYRNLYCGLWAHFALYKYISCWLLTEASCIRFGLSYNGTRTEGGASVSQWDGCNNIKLLRFESATRFQHYIDSFNCNTNHFAAEYVYKRLRFLGNRNLSQLITLTFLALWHGTQSGYYMTFLNEFLIMVMDLESMLLKTEFYHKI